MKRHIQDFNRFSVNEMITGSVPPPEGIENEYEKKRAYKLGMNLIRYGLVDVDRTSNTPHPHLPTAKMTYKFLVALAEYDVLISVDEWRGSSGGQTEITLYGTPRAVKMAFKYGLDPDTAAEYIRDMEEGLFDA